MGTTCVVAPATTHILAWPKNRMPSFYSYFLIQRYSSYTPFPELWFQELMAQTYCFVDRFILKFRVSDSQRLKVVWHRAETTGSSNFHCSVYIQYVISVICNQWSASFICVSTICDFYRISISVHTLQEQGMINNISQYFNVFQIVTSARRRNHY